MEHSNWIDKYLHTRYVGCVAGDTTHTCNLYYKDINNFIQNAGLYADLEIYRVEDGDILLNTFGNLINRIWPIMSYSLRECTETTNDINYIANQFQKMREHDGDFPEPLPKVTKFMKEVFGQEIIIQNKELHEAFNAAEEEGMDEDDLMEMIAT